MSPPAPLLRRLLEVAPAAELLTGYGLTEATALVTLTPVRPGAHGLIARERTIGRVLDGMDMAVVDDEGAFQPAGAVGEFVVRGPNVMKGYLAAPADTAAALQGGWLRTGDIGCFDADGYAFILDRKKDVIIRGGQNIYPADIEEAPYRVDGVAEAAAIGRADDLHGEVPVAFVAFRRGCRLSSDTLLEHCRTRLAAYKLPVEVHVLLELPKGPTGKILRRALRPVEVAPA